jgi:zinc protease
MMFQGSKNYDADYFTPLQEAGANINGSTNSDRTNYYEVVPSNFLELALFMEADRMGGLLEAMTMEKLDNQRDVVKNERRQKLTISLTDAGEKIGEIMYPKGHPYNWSVIGSLDDLSAASMEDVKSVFPSVLRAEQRFARYCRRFRSETSAKTWVEKYFGRFAKGGDITRPNPAQPKLDKETRVTMEDALNCRVFIWFGTAFRKA